MASPTIKVKRSSVSGKIPTITQLDLGELAVNTFDGKVYLEQDQSSVGVGTTVIVINPWSVGTGTNTYNTYFTAGNVGVGSTLPTSKFSVVGNSVFVGITTINGLKFPSSDGTNGQVLQTDGTTASFATVSGGAAWQAVVTSSLTVVAKSGYFVNTSGGVITATLPASPTLGDFISFIDYAGTFDTNNLTIARNGKNIQGSATDLTVATERAGLTLVFTDNTQGWLLQNN